MVRRNAQIERFQQLVATRDALAGHSQGNS